MRTALAVAMCLAAGGCSEGGSDALGTWDLVSVNGESLPYQGMTEHWAEVKKGGVVNLHMVMDGESEPQVFRAEYSLGEEKNGCIEYNGRDHQTGEPLAGSVCGTELTLETVDGTTIHYHRRF